MPEAASFEASLRKVSKFVLRQSTVLNFLICATSTSFFAWRVSTLVEETIKPVTDLPLLDSRWSYTPEEAQTLLQDLGREGRNDYLRINLHDFAFIPSMSALLAMTIGPLFRRSGLAYQWNLFPVTYMLLDFAETAVIRYLLVTYPAPAHAISFAAGELTRYKYRFFFYTLAVLIFGLGAVTRKMLQSWWRQRAAAAHRD